MNIEYKKYICNINILYCSDFIEKKQKFIIELDELNKPKEQTLFDEYENTKHFWNRPIFNNVVKYVLEKDSKKIIETNKSSSLSLKVSETNS